jgi:hypothetical protein
MTCFSFAQSPSAQEEYLNGIKEIGFADKYTTFHAMLFPKLMSGELLTEAGIDPQSEDLTSEKNGELMLQLMQKKTIEFYSQNEIEYKTDYAALVKINEKFRGQIQAALLVPTPKLDSRGKIDRDDLKNKIRQQLNPNAQK